jgi:hypothetical protein
MLILIGLLALAATFLQSPIVTMLFLPALGMLFLIWGLAARHVVPLVPGGILLGLGVGIIVAQQLYGNANSRESGGVIVIGLGGGFILITLLSRVVSPRLQVWPLVPGIILIALGAAVLIGGVALEIVNVAGLVWPILLIAIGAYLLLQAGRGRRKAGK